MVRRKAGRVRQFTGFSAVVLAIALPSRDATAQPDSLAVAREALIRAEDARGRIVEEVPARDGRRSGGLNPILDALGIPALRAQAVRAIGRLEQPELVGHVVPFLADGDLRATAAEAVAQSLRGLAARPDWTRADSALVDSAFALLRDRARAESRPEVTGVLARSLARLPYRDPRQARGVEAMLASLASPDRSDAAVEGIAHGLHTLARARRALGDPSAAALDWLRRAAVATSPATHTAPIRRVAWLALNASGASERLPAAEGVEDRDPQVRRLALQALRHVADTVQRQTLLARAARDGEPMVRVDWVAVHRALRPGDCAPLLQATRDPNPHVALAAIDALGGPCGSKAEGGAALRAFIAAGPNGVTARPATGYSWHARAHALVALSRADPQGAAPLLWVDSRHPVWQVRMYVARGAAVIRDSAVLSRLAFDTVGSVREVALAGLSATVGHLADGIYVRGLTSPDHHVVLAAARALRGAPLPDSVLPAVLDALERLHREGRQTSRDPRLELLARVDEMADGSAAARLRPMLEDVDGEVARRVQGILARLEPGSRAAVWPVTWDTAAIPRGPVRIRVAMSAASGGGTFEILLDPANAPVTAARVVALVRARYYDGLTFHRVVPNFVLQGGSPGMNEYVGTGPFMRDELGLAHHERGTLGISTRGRDTGDAQWFINLVDNYRLDHEYTVWARVVVGMDVVDGILEGDVMESVALVEGGG